MAPSAYSHSSQFITHTNPPTQSATYTAVIFGATGATGRHVLRELLESPSYSKVLEAGRRVTPVDTLPASAKDKLVQQTVDFEKLEAEKLSGYDHVYITCVQCLVYVCIDVETYGLGRLGTTRKAAGSAEAFERIDREYVLCRPPVTHLSINTATLGTY